LSKVDFSAPRFIRVSALSGLPNFRQNDEDARTTKSKMKSVQDYIDHAEHCERLAASAADENQKRLFLDLAQEWRKLAAAREQHLRQIAAVQTEQRGRK
jgi:hypothetical protein